ncbi:hypothetical protein F5H01DRAFT_334995 [Linnemannia elongata]|nr:hypothetical protein F5H01DRAFT_334995 [Linnemannia elongata]
MNVKNQNTIELFENTLACLLFFSLLSSLLLVLSVPIHPSPFLLTMGTYNKSAMTHLKGTSYNCSFSPCNSPVYILSFCRRGVFQEE